MKANYFQIAMAASLLGAAMSSFAMHRHQGAGIAHPPTPEQLGLRTSYDAALLFERPQEPKAKESYDIIKEIINKCPYNLCAKCKIQYCRHPEYFGPKHIHECPNAICELKKTIDGILESYASFDFHYWRYTTWDLCMRMLKNKTLFDLSLLPQKHDPATAADQEEINKLEPALINKLIALVREHHAWAQGGQKGTFTFTYTETM